MRSKKREIDPISAVWWAIAYGQDEGHGTSYLLHDGQIEMRELAQSLIRREVRGRVCTFRMARRFGKSFWMTSDFMECGVRKKSQPWLMKYAAPTKEDAYEIVMEHADSIAREIPAPIRPYWAGHRSAWVFADGSYCKVVGCDDRRKANRLRGRSMHRGYVDEPGSIPEVRYLMRSVLIPQLMTTGGIIVYAGTPSDTPAHDSSGYFAEAEAAGRGFHRTIYDAPHVTDEVRAEFLLETCPELTEEEAAGLVRERSGPEEGLGASDWWREYMAHFVVDSDRAVIPEFSRHERFIVEEVEPPPFRYTYVAMDLGYHDLTFALLAYVHFERGLLVIEDEVVMRHATSKAIDEAIEARERALWSERRVPVDHPKKWEPHEPVRRVVDAPEQVVADLRSFHGRRWDAAQKDDSDAAVNAVRLAVVKHQIRIHPRCTALISHLRHAIWNRSRTSFERSGDFGHFDGVDALKYLLREASFTRNPYPRLWQGERRETHWVPHRQERSASRALGRALRGKL